MESPLTLWSVAYACGMISYKLSTWFVGLIFPTETEPEYDERGW